MLYARRKIDLLDRKYDFLIELPPGDFLLELENFVHFLLTDEIIVQYVNALFSRYKRRNREFSKIGMDLNAQLLEIREDIAEKYPHLDDVNIARPDHSQDEKPNETYLNSFAYFDSVADKIKSNISDNYPDDKVKKAISTLEGILRYKLSTLEHSKEAEKLFVKLSFLSDSKVHLFRKINNYHRTSPDGSLVTLCNIAEKINPTPHQYVSLADLGETVIENLILSEYQAIQEILSMVAKNISNFLIYTRFIFDVLMKVLELKLVLDYLTTKFYNGTRPVVLGMIGPD